MSVRLRRVCPGSILHKEVNEKNIFNMKTWIDDEVSSL